MIHFLFIALWCSLWLIVEALTRSIGLFLPLTAFAVFYFSCTAGLKTGAITAAVFGILLNGIFGHITLLSPFLLMTAIPLALIFRRNITNFSLLLLPATGGLLALFTVTLHILHFGGIPALVALAPNLFISILFSVPLLPVMIMLSDKVSTPLALMPFSELMRHGIDAETE